MNELNEKKVADLAEDTDVGLTYDEAVIEAKRCLQCKTKPCVDGCVAHMNIPEMMRLFLDGKGQEALEVAIAGNCFPEICGRVCYQEIQCELNCVRNKVKQPVKIGKIERFIGDTYTSRLKPIQAPYLGKVAIIGSGPAGLACAYDLLQHNVAVTIYEKKLIFGGVLKYGIPSFRLPNEIVDEQIEELKKAGAEFIGDINFSKTLSLAEILNLGYDAVFIGVGASASNFMKIPGAMHERVFSWKRFLEAYNINNGADIELLKNARNVAVVGGGNVAMDVTRSAKRLGMEVHLIYRRAYEQMPARLEEIEAAHKEGIIFHLLRDPISIDADDINHKVTLVCKKTKMVEDAEDVRGKIVDDIGFEEFKADLIVMAIGSSVKDLREDGLDTDRDNRILVDENQHTSLKRVYAGGDAVSGSATVIHALKTGKRAAASIIEQLKK